MATDTNVTSGELTTVITEMLDRITQVATLVDQAFPDKTTSVGIKDCGEKLKQYVEVLSLKAAGVEVLDTDAEVGTLEDIHKRVIQECVETLKLLNEWRKSPADAGYRNLCDYVLGLLHYLKDNK